ncbi:hypothetical protein HPP92_010621 [Vanilla planifolia]|uniref:Uncharacterized protein n=1 Tax=Vanilla planifolia TaxID=51239 RepID=A0A835QUM5_VANPL|nr:hypothetical protein HPP92_010848 [Vanilla planifolia]KAG0482537.1 hypothetical protein HPP92_010621 [Vanilla planifolia]
MNRWNACGLRYSAPWGMKPPPSLVLLGERVRCAEALRIADRALARLSSREEVWKREEITSFGGELAKRKMEMRKTRRTINVIRGGDIEELRPDIALGKDEAKTA